MLRLVCAHAGRETVFESVAAEISVGRPRAGVQVDLDLTPDQGASRPHARIWSEEGGYWIEDSGSRRGTRLGGEEIRGRGRQALHDGAIIYIGDTTLRVSLLPAAALPEIGLDPPLDAPLGPPLDPEVEIGEAIPATGVAAVPVEAASEATRRRLALLCELPLEFGAAPHLDDLLQTVVARLIEVIPGAASATLLVSDPATGELLLKAHVPPGRPMVSLTLGRRALEQREGFAWRRGADASQSQLVHQMDSGMCAPLLWQGQALGVLSVMAREGGATLGGADLSLLMAVAHYAAMAVASQQLRDDLRSTATVLGRLLTSYSPRLRQTLLDRAKRGRLRQGGEKSEVTVLCSDIRGFPRMAASMDTEDVVDLLNDYFPVLVEAIFRYDGTIDKFVGDGILAVFGSPEPDPRQHEKAVRAALAMQEAARTLTRSRKERGQVTCEIGVGVHCGEVLHGFIGAAERMEFTVIGDAVNRASRYCDGARAGEVLISPALHQRVWRVVEAEPAAIVTKHEGELAAFRVVKALTTTTQ